MKKEDPLFSYDISLDASNRLENIFRMMSTSIHIPGYGSDRPQIFLLQLPRHSIHHPTELPVPVLNGSVLRTSSPLRKAVPLRGRLRGLGRALAESSLRLVGFLKIGGVP